MKTLLISIFLIPLSFTATANADYQDEISLITARLQEFSTGDAGMNDPERFFEIVKMTYEYSMLSFPEFATYVGDPT